MTIHCSLEELSSYLDAEVGTNDRSQVEAHVEKCAECRRRLAGLEEVAGHLARLESVAPPPTLGWQVESRLRRVAGRQTIGRMLEERVGQWLRPPLYAPLVATVLALAAIAYLLALGVAVRSDRPTQIVVAAPRDAAVSDAAGESGQQAAAEPRHQVTDLRVEDQPAILQVAGREFELRDGVWWQLDLDSAGVARAIDLRRGDELPRALAGLRERPGVYIVDLEEEIVRVVVPRPALEAP